MTRKEFLKTSAIFGSIILLPSFSEMFHFQKYTLSQLIGKGNHDIIGDSYVTRMHKETAAAFETMKKKAAEERIALEVVSAYRSFDRQKEIFENKYRKFTQQGLRPADALQKIIEYSTIPGTSRHHWGTDLDLIDGNAQRPNDVLLAEHFHGNGPFCKMKEWMNQYAEDFGFYEVYTDEPTRKGFKYEPWHFSYAPVSIPMLNAYRNLDVKKIIIDENLLGNEAFTNDFIQAYWSEQILDINPSLL